MACKAERLAGQVYLWLLSSFMSNADTRLIRYEYFFSIPTWYRNPKAVMPDRGRVPSRISPTSRILRRSSVSVSSAFRSPTHGHAVPA